MQKDNAHVEYIDVGNALIDVCSKQNHTIFARRGCGKTLLLHASSRQLSSDLSVIYLNCEDFKKHSFPNVLVEILSTLFVELNKNFRGWFGKGKESKNIITGIISRLQKMQQAEDARDEAVKQTLSMGTENSASAAAGAPKSGLNLNFGINKASKTQEQTELSFQSHKDEIQDLDLWLPSLKSQIRDFFAYSKKIKVVFIQLDDLYQLKRTDQAFVIDYIHRLCKDLPLYFKIATLRHASTLYVDRDGQPIGAQGRHDYQPINIDYTFTNFKKTKDQNWEILQQFASKAGISNKQLAALFRGEG